MKKTLAILCAGIIACTMASCGNDMSNDESVNSPTQTESVGTEKKEQSDDVITSSKDTETEADTDSKAERNADENNTETEADADMENSQ